MTIVTSQTVTAISPTSGDVDTVVTITGTNFGGSVNVGVVHWDHLSSPETNLPYGEPKESTG